MTKFSTAAAFLAATAMTSSAALTVLDSSSFANQYIGTDIFDGAATINGWVATGGASNAHLSLNGSNVVLTLDDTNGWIEHNNGTTPWELGAGSWTVETRALIGANPTTPGSGGLNIWGALNGERDIMTIHEVGVTNFGGTSYDSNSNLGAFHTFRLTYDSADDVYHYFRDGVQITPLAGIPQQATTGQTRLILGDCCTNAGGSSPFGGPDTVIEFEYVRYDNTGAFAPVPEPSSAALLGLAGFALILRRKRR